MNTADSVSPMYEQIKKGPRKSTILGIVVLFIFVVLVATQITFFAVQPIGAVPDGVTIVMLRGQGTQLFDSADAMCMRIQDGVSLLCRGVALGTIGKNATILFRLPYIDFIYTLSTGGARFDK